MKKRKVSVNLFDLACLCVGKVSVACFLTIAIVYLASILFHVVNYFTDLLLDLIMVQMWIPFAMIFVGVVGAVICVLKMLRR